MLILPVLFQFCFGCAEQVKKERKTKNEDKFKSCKDSRISVSIIRTSKIDNEIRVSLDLKVLRCHGSQGDMCYFLYVSKRFPLPTTQRGNSFHFQEIGKNALYIINFMFTCIFLRLCFIIVLIVKLFLLFVLCL